MQELEKEKYFKEKYHFDDLREIVKVLRSPQGCPWDRAQTHESITGCLEEECYEVIDAVCAGNLENLKEELGDVLLQVLLHAQIGEEKGEFSLEEIVDGLAHKLVRRHPHVFGAEEAATSPQEGLSRWDSIKKQEKPDAQSPMDSIPQAFPAKMYARKALSKAKKYYDIDISDASEMEEIKNIKNAIKDLENMENTLTNETKRFITKVRNEFEGNKLHDNIPKYTSEES